MIILFALLSFLGLVTFFLTRNSMRPLKRWHLTHVQYLTYQQLIDLILVLVEFIVISILVFFGPNSSYAKFLSVIKEIHWDWHFALFVVLYLLALVEITMLILIGFVELILKKNSRQLFKQMNWLAFRKEKAAGSFLILSLAVLEDAVLYLAILPTISKLSLTTLILLVMTYALIKACRYKDWLTNLLALGLFSFIGMWCLTATFLYGWLAGAFLLAVTYLVISFKEQDL